MSDRPAPCELMADTPLCDVRLIEQLSETEREERERLIAKGLLERDPPQPLCERRLGHPGSHYGEAPNYTAVWDEEVIFRVSHDREWSSFMPRGNYHGRHAEESI